MDTFYQQIMAIIIPAAVTAIGLMITLGLHKFKQYVQTQTNNATIMFAVDRLQDIIETVVDEINQNTKQASEDGSLTAEEAKRIKDLAVRKIFSQIPPDLTKALEQATGNLRSWVDAKIEQAVYERK